MTTVAYRSRHRCTACSCYHTPKCDHRGDLRWPLGPLVELVAARGNAESVAAALGHSPERVRLAAEFGLSDQRADHWATRLGLHPAQVWPDWIDAGLSVVDRQRIEGGWRPAWIHTEQTPSTERQEDAA